MQRELVHVHWPLEEGRSVAKPRVKLGGNEGEGTQERGRWRAEGRTTWTRDDEALSLDPEWQRRGRAGERGERERVLKIT